MVSMFRIKAHLCVSPTHDEEKAEVITLFAAINQSDKKIASGEFFGQIIEDGVAFPFRYDIRQNPDRTGFYFGGCSYDEESKSEEIYRTNLHDRTIVTKEYFSVRKSDATDYTYVIDHVVDMNMLSS